MLAVVVSLLAVLLQKSDALYRLESASWDMRVRLRAKPSAHTPSIKVILLDQTSLDWASDSFQWAWPWPREVYGPLIEFVRRGGAKAIAFDVLFLEPSGFGVHDDVTLGQVMGAKPDVVGAVYLGKSSGKSRVWPAGYATLGSVLTHAALEGAAVAPERDQVARMSAPIPEIGTNAAILGNVQDAPDEDGTFRHASLLRYLGDEPVLSLGAAMYALTHAPQLTPAQLTFHESGALAGFKHVPLNADSRALMNFRGPSQTHETFNAAAIIRSELAMRGGETNTPLDPAVFKDAYVFFGFSAPGLMDLRPTPVSKVYPGVEIHATILDNLLAGDFMCMARPGTL